MKKRLFILAASTMIAACLLGGCGKSTKGNSSTNGNQNTSESKDIGEKKAQEIAIADAGVKQENLSRLKVSKEQDDTHVVYDVDFTDHTNGMEYDYEILASDGSIYSVESEKINNTSDKTNTKTPADVKLSQEEASKLALDKVKGATAKELYIHLEQDNGVNVYDGEIIYNEKEYDFEIDADTGEFLEWKEKTYKMTENNPR